MQKILIAGAGKIGSLIACLLAKDSQVHIIDIDLSGADISSLLQRATEITTATIDITNHTLLQQYIHDHRIDALISSLPHTVNVEVAKIAKSCQVHYFDLTEDVSMTRTVKTLAQGESKAFVPQCGLAPGFISIVANDLMQRFDRIDSAKLRVGALPQRVNNALHYALTWSTEGLINQYANVCQAIVNGKKATAQPLGNLESIQLDGLYYEAFNTSGGLGSLVDSYAGKVESLDYKTIRYPGHCEKMRILMDDLKLGQDRQTLKTILENAIPKTYQDVVLVYVAVTGWKNNVYVEENYMKKIYPKTIFGITWSAIQVTTAASLCAIVDLVLKNPKRYQGLVLQEQISLTDFLANRFAVYYQ